MSTKTLNNAWSYLMQKEKRRRRRPSNVENKKSVENKETSQKRKYWLRRARKVKHSWKKTMSLSLQRHVTSRNRGHVQRRFIADDDNTITTKKTIGERIPHIAAR